jgi:nucleotide-binding universal stress UspA family protein
MHKTTINRIFHPSDFSESSEVAFAHALKIALAGKNGFLDVLRGTTTERVLREASCPVLAMPVGSFLG